MSMRRPRGWWGWTALLLALPGAFIVLVCLVSVFCVAVYQQPLAKAAATSPFGPSPFTAGAPLPAGKIRVRLLAGSLIIANGNLPGGRAVQVGTTLGYMSRPGMTWFFSSPAKGLSNLLRAGTWKYFFFKEHVQVQLLPVGIALLIPWGVRQWMDMRRPAWACRGCGYDLRGAAAGRCPECGAESLLKEAGAGC